MSDNTEMKSQKKPELLIPASSLEVLRTAVLYGADAVYIGGEVFSLRAKAKNFSMDEMAEGIAFAHEHGVKVYVTANILAHNDDLTEAREYFTALRDLKYLPPVASTEGRKECKEARPDALIISDPGMFMVAREVWPDCEIHVSTQANNTNYETQEVVETTTIENKEETVVVKTTKKAKKTAKKAAKTKKSENGFISFLKNIFGLVFKKTTE